MNWLSELILTAEERNWCTWSACQVCGENVGFRLFVRALRREEVIENLRMLSQEMCDRHVGLLLITLVRLQRSFL